MANEWSLWCHWRKIASRKHQKVIFYIFVSGKLLQRSCRPPASCTWNINEELRHSINEFNRLLYNKVCLLANGNSKRLNSELQNRKVNCGRNVMHFLHVTIDNISFSSFEMSILQCFSPLQNETEIHLIYIISKES